MSSSSPSPLAPLRLSFTRLVDSFSYFLSSLSDAPNDAKRPNQLAKQVIQQEHAFQTQLQLVKQQYELQERIDAAHCEIARYDGAIRSLAATLGGLEQKLYEAENGGAGIGGEDEIENKAIPLDALLISSARLGCMSFSPGDFLEKRGLTNARPPAPLERQMANSLLQKNIQQLVELSQERKKAASKDADDGAPAQAEKFSAFLHDFSSSTPARSFTSQQAAAVKEQAAALSSMEFEVDLNPDFESSEEEEDQ